MYKLAPSILSADFNVLGSQIKTIEEAGAPYLHIDVMDGSFVNNISIGIPVIKSIRTNTNMVFDVHLMIVEPDRFIEEFALAGADIINVHLEACKDIRNTINRIKSFNKKTAITIKPHTHIDTVYPYLEDVDMVLIMSVEPGFGGQAFIPESLNRAEKIANFIAKNNLKTDIEMDGGIHLGNVRDVMEAGVNVIVAGSSVFQTKDIGQTVREFYKVFESIPNNK